VRNRLRCAFAHDAQHLHAVLIDHLERLSRESARIPGALHRERSEPAHDDELRDEHGHGALFILGRTGSVLDLGELAERDVGERDQLNDVGAGRGASQWHEPATPGERRRGAARLHRDAHRTEAGEGGDDLRDVEHDRGSGSRAQVGGVSEVAAG
jgi:hypothetical protein